MSYVPGFEHDIFFSYPQDDSAEWIRALEVSLQEQLNSRLGAGVDIWRDTRNIRFGQNWCEEITSGIVGSAAFLSIISPSYRASDWCARERKIFLDHCKTTGKLKAGRYYRFLKLIRLPWPDNLHERFHSELQQVSFFQGGRAGEEDVELVPGTDEFRMKAREASRAIAALLVEMRRSRQAVFIACGSEDWGKAGDELRRELRAHAYDVRPDGPLDEGYADDLIEQDLKPAVLSVHILGAAYDPFVEHLIDLAIRLDKRTAFWLTSEGEASQDARQRKLIEQIRSEEKQRGDWALLRNRSSRAVIDDILRMLEPKPALPRVNGAGAAVRIYVLCDLSTYEDAERARNIQAKISETEKMQVDLPPVIGSGGATRADLHYQLLRECDGLLLYRKAAPEHWLFQALPDVVYTERLVERPPVRSKAFLLNDPAILRGFTGVPVITQSDDSRLGDLEPFLAPLRKRGEHATG
jgi:hypothetical protein